MTVISKYGALSTATRAAEEVFKERKRAAEDTINLVDTAVANNLPRGWLITFHGGTWPKNRISGSRYPKLARTDCH